MHTRLTALGAGLGVLALSSCAFLQALVPDAGVAAKTAAQKPGGAVERSATSAGLTVTLRAVPARVKAGGVVHFTATAQSEHATGALGYSLTYGDQTSAPPVALPQFCLAPPGRAAEETWHFTHRYEAAGRYHVTLSGFVNCGGQRASVSVTVTAL